MRIKTHIKKKKKNQPANSSSISSSFSSSFSFSSFFHPSKYFWTIERRSFGDEAFPSLTQTSGGFAGFFFFFFFFFFFLFGFVSKNQN